jgi:8-oxo-dGTP pyrophosphatase MutT (NUDIX family)
MDKYKPYVVPVSIKGVVIDGNKVWLRKNERNEWELPGGKMDEGEQPEETIIRELEEELGFVIKPVEILNSHLYTIEVLQDESRGVMVISYLCNLIEKVGNFELEGEAGKAEFKQFTREDTDDLNIPTFYKVAIEKAFKVRSNL